MISNDVYSTLNLLQGNFCVIFHLNNMVKLSSLSSLNFESLNSYVRKTRLPVKLAFLSGLLCGSGLSSESKSAAG